jgi:hypothetical protein
MSKANLLEGEFTCCGALCKKEAQSHIDRMQRAIDAAHEYFNHGSYSAAMFEELVKELQDLPSN